MGPREYRSPQRQRSAAATRQAILDAAEELFVTTGYAATTVAAIAARADVALNTVYGSVGSKADVVLGLIGRGKADPLIASTLAEVEQCNRPEDAVGVLAHGVCQSFAKLLPIVSVMYGTAADPTIAKAVEETEAAYLENLNPLVKLLSQNGWLRPELSEADALDILWFYLGPAPLRSLASKGWSWEKIETWIATQTRGALLPDMASGI